MATDAADRFSDVPDDLLVHVISFLPVRDATRTAVLSRRWRPLWLRTGTVNLDSGFYQTRALFSFGIDGERLFRDADAALNAAGRDPVRRLSVFVKEHSDRVCQAVLGSSRYMVGDFNRLHDLLLKSPSLQKLEELRVGFGFSYGSSLRYILKLPPRILPAQTLRVLDLAWCRLELPGASFFPRLASLRLARCSAPKHHLEALTRAAPRLAALHIEHHDFFDINDTSLVEKRSKRLLLHCPNLTALTMHDLGLYRSMDVYAPRLRSLSYSGGFIEFCMKSVATNLTGVSLSFKYYFDEDQKSFGLLWRQFLAGSSLRSIKALKLRLLHIKDLVVDEGVLDEGLPVFHSLQRLEIQVAIDLDCSRKEPAAAIATMLGHCPVLRDLRLVFRDGPWRRYRTTSVRPQFDTSVDLFDNRESKEAALMLSGDSDDLSSVPDLPELTGCWFSCLHDHLKCVKLQFECKKLNCFEVCLAKFLAENCKVLEMFHIEHGDQHFLSHVNHKVERWRLNALKQSDRT